MNKIFRPLLLVAVIAISVRGYAQQLIQPQNDGYKLVENKKLFIGNSLSNLLSQIKLPIKRMAAIAGGEDAASHIYFWFVDNNEYRAFGKRTGKFPIKIDVLITEKDFDCSTQLRPAGQRLDWTKDDEKKYENLTVMNMRVTGSN